MGKAQVPLYFVVPARFRQIGSTKMRSSDLVSIIGPFLGDVLTPRIVAMPGEKYARLQRLWALTRPRGGIYFLTKNSCRMDGEAAAILKSRSHGICCDYVDHDLLRIPAEVADVHVCSSYAQQDWIVAKQSAGKFAGGPTQVILHNADAGLYRLPPAVHRDFSAVYCGDLENTHIPQKLAERITFLDGSKPKRMKRNMARLPGFALHYCIRNQTVTRKSVIKPFTKGVTAAVLGANLVTSRDVPDAVRLLGEDYPFLANGSADEQIIDAFERAHEAFGGPDWQRGLEALQGLREQVSGPALAAQLRSMASLLEVS